MRTPYIGRGVEAYADHLAGASPEQPIPYVAGRERVKSYKEVRDAVADEIARQGEMAYSIGNRWHPRIPDELLTPDHLAKGYFPRVDTEKLQQDHTLVFTSAEELAHVIAATQELGRYRFDADIDALIKHESQHAVAARLLGQKSVRFLARLQVQAPAYLPDGKEYQPIIITPSTLLEDVTTSRLGVAVFLGFPEDTAEAIEDTLSIQALGFPSAAVAMQEAKNYNERTHTTTYPLPPYYR